MSLEQPAPAVHGGVAQVVGGAKAIQVVEQAEGILITEKFRGSGANLVNIDGEQFVNEREPRDVEAAAIIKECVAKAHPVFEGLQPRGVMDWDYYGPVIAHFFFEGQDTPDETMAAAFALCHSAPPGGYAAGTMIGSYRFGEGMFIVNTRNVLGNLDRHPAADRLMLNLVRYAAGSAGEPLAALPGDFDEQIKAIGYKTE